VNAQNTPSYMKEPWFALLQGACVNRQRREVAELLGVSPVTVSQVLNASGKYGAGTASTTRVALRVLDTFGSAP
jgi:DNA-binding transcriptional regulator YdaS (Cro superfamily)